ncbi:MAG: nucleotidyltransferase domain-containing protein [Acidobacteriaceae bacterium]
MIPDRIRAAVREHPYPLQFATVSGAHLYGFPSADSDWDLRGAHILPAAEIFGLHPLRETIEESERSSIELDLVTHDVRKFFRLLLKPNGYVLEQLYSPLIVEARPEHEELKRIARGCITRFHVHHYLGFAANQWKLFHKENPPRVKPLLYVFRVLLTGIHLMQTGEIEANLGVLNREFNLPFIPELITRKTSGAEHEQLETNEMAFFEEQYCTLQLRLKESGERTSLPAEPAGRAELSDLLVRLRMKTIGTLSTARQS